MDSAFALGGGDIHPKDAKWRQWLHCFALSIIRLALGMSDLFVTNAYPDLIRVNRNVFWKVIVDIKQSNGA